MASILFFIILAFFPCLQPAHAAKSTDEVVEERWTPPCYDMSVSQSDPQATTGGSRVDVSSICYRYAHIDEAIAHGSADKANVQSMSYQALIGEPTEILSSSSTGKTTMMTTFCSRFGISECGSYPSLSVSVANKRRLEALQERALQKKPAYQANSGDAAVVFRRVDIASETAEGAVQVDDTFDFNSGLWSTFNVDEAQRQDIDGQLAKHFTISTTLEAHSKMGNNATFKLIFEIGSSALTKEGGALVAPTFMKISFNATYAGLARKTLVLVADVFGQMGFDGEPKRGCSTASAVCLDQLYFSWEANAKSYDGTFISVEASSKDRSDLHKGTYFTKELGYDFFFERFTFLFKGGNGLIDWDPELGFGIPPATQSELTGESRSYQKTPAPKKRRMKSARKVRRKRRASKAMKKNKSNKRTRTRKRKTKNGNAQN